jgi:5,10-methylene-tetrahydrofolate dehydrogenase/methenyl tetrahydrofolate cyclohydrolase
VDGFHAENVGRLSQGQEAFVPCTPNGVMEMLKSIEAPLRGAEAVVIGRSNIVGKPMAMLLTAAGATVTVCHSGTRDLNFHTRRADILVAAIGKPKFVTGDMVKPGAIVIDVGINRLQDGRMRQAVRRRGFRLRQGSRRRHHPGARRCRPDDHHHAARQHRGLRRAGAGQEPG